MKPSRWRVLIASIIVAIPHLTHAQSELSTGLVFMDESQYQSIPLAVTPLKGDIPAAADMSGDFPEPGNQGAQGSCVGWATAYAFKSFQERMERQWEKDRNEHVFSPAYIYNQIKLGSCTAGARFEDALNLLRREGVAPLADFPYVESDCDTAPNALARQSARPYAIADWRRVNLRDPIEMKTQIASGFPVLIGMMVDDGFMRLGRGQIYEVQSGQARGGHAMVVVGYDDARQAFKLINSWGRHWGDDGFGWVSYRAFRETVREAYVAQDIISAPPIRPNPDPVLDPEPTQKQPTASIGQTAFLHNHPVSTPTGPQPGMKLLVPVTLRNAAGRRVQVIVKFSYANGPMLFANPHEIFYRDISGLVATATAVHPVGSDHEDFLDQGLLIPYYALNFQPTNYTANYMLAFSAQVMIDGQLVAQSPPNMFPFRW